MQKLLHPKPQLPTFGRGQIACQMCYINLRGYGLYYAGCPSQVSNPCPNCSSHYDYYVSEAYAEESRLADKFVLPRKIVVWPEQLNTPGVPTERSSKDVSLDDLFSQVLSMEI